MQDQHIASAYDRDLEGIQSMIIRMGGLVEAAIVEGTRSLETRDVHLAEQVRAGDKAIDALEEQINEECARVIALRAPVSKDLRIILTTIKLASSLERVGDYAKNIAKRTTVLAELRPISGTVCASEVPETGRAPIRAMVAGVTSSARSPSITEGWKPRAGAAPTFSGRRNTSIARARCAKRRMKPRSSNAVISR